MSDDALRISRLEVRRAPGIDDGGFVLDGLVDGVNVVFGPNGSGKTTTAGAIEAVLWPAAAAVSGSSLTARFTLAGGEWIARVEGRELRVQRDGLDVNAPAPPRADLRHRYRLHLHELLLAEHSGRDFAAEMMRESAGGYDLPGAAARLGIVNPSPKGGPESKALAAARTRLADVHATERALQREVERLGELETRLDRARAAHGRLAAVDAAIVHARCRRAHEEALTALAAFDARAATLVGDELERLEALDRQAADAGRRADAAEGRRADAVERQRQALPSGALPDALIPTLRAELGELDSLRPQVAAAEGALSAAATACETALRAIGDGVSEARIAAVELRSLGDLSRWARDAELLRADRLVLERELAALECDPPPYTLDALGRGAALLEAWLAVPQARSGGDARPRGYMIATAVLAMTAAVLLALTARSSVAPVATAAAIFVGAMVLLALALHRPAGGDPRADHREGYSRLQLPQPASWETAAVAALLDDLREQASLARDAARRRDRRADVERRFQELVPRHAEMEARRAELVELLGVAPATDATAIAWMVERIGRWQNARETLAAARGALAALRARQTSVRDAITARLAPYATLPDEAGDAELRGATEALAQRERTYTEAREELRLAEHDHAAAVADRVRIAGEREAILARAGVGEDEIALLALWTECLPDHHDARQRETVAAAQLRSARAALESLPGFADRLVDAPEGELELDRAAAQSDAAELESLVEQANDIRRDVTRARAGRDVADALAAAREAESRLRDACRRDVEAAVGAGLVAFLQDATRDQQRPAVFIRAREIFLRITHGTWRLDLGDDDEPAFRAYHTGTKVGHALGELSSATRMQLLLAVRLAFVETQEREQGGARLPLLLDETLGTCDDARARTVVESVLALARDGRQLFYFTAQWDEVEKWHAAMAGQDVPVAIHRLDEIRAGAHLHVERPPRSALPRPALPAPDGLTHAEYGRALGVPSIARDTGSASGAHLWHLTDDLPLLHHLLGQGIETWGSLESLVEYGGGALLADFPGAFPRIRAAADALKAALRWSRLGRGRPVDRQALVESGAISDRFIDAIADLADDFHGDAARLVEHLAEGRVKYFRTNLADQLRDHLMEHGYMSEESPLAPEQIAARTMAAVAPELTAGLLGRDQLDRIVTSVLPPGVPGGELPIAHPGLATIAARTGPSDQR